jgi:hypothetical protein
MRATEMSVITIEISFLVRSTGGTDGGSNFMVVRSRWKKDGYKDEPENSWRLHILAFPFKTL